MCLLPRATLHSDSEQVMCVKESWMNQKWGVCVCVSVFVCFGPERIPQQKERSW